MLQVRCLDAPLPLSVQELAGMSPRVGYASLSLLSTCAWACRVKRGSILPHVRGMSYLAVENAYSCCFSLTPRGHVRNGDTMAGSPSEDLAADSHWEPKEAACRPERARVSGFHVFSERSQVRSKGSPSWALAF